MNVVEAIERRVSTRDYSTETVPSAELAAVRDAGEAAEPLAAARLRFHLVESGKDIEAEVKGILGDYGKVIRAPHYVVLSAIETDHYLLDAGFRFEQMILDATRRGLGTCWVAGWFREESLRRALGLDASERIVALTPVGVPTGASFLGRFVRNWVKGAARKPLDELFAWGHPGERLPEKIRADARWTRLLEAARRAPSWANKQPWRFVVRSDELLLYKQARQLKEGKDYHVVDCGIVMAHVHLAARALGMPGRWSLEPFALPPGLDAPAEAIGRFAFDPGAA